MNKEYQKPEVEYISLVTREPVATDEELALEAELGIVSNPF